MLQQQVRARGVCDQRVLSAMMEVPRERLIPEGVRHAAYEDRALPIGHDQTISQPFIVAYMTEQLDVPPDGRVLEIGTGSAYQTAILARLCRHVYSIERLAALHELAERNLRELGIDNVTLVLGDGSRGLPAEAPFDRILVAAASPRVPKPLIDQLALGGILVIPVGGEAEQTIVRVERRVDRSVEIPTLACRFVKLIGEEGWQLTPGR